MTDGKLLDNFIKDSGISITFIADKMECSRNRVYAIIGGAECTASEIVALTTILHLNKDQRDLVFLREKVN